MPLLLFAGFQVRPPNTSTATTSPGPKMRLPDSVFALSRALLLLLFFLRFAGAPVSPPRKALLTRPWLFSRLRQRREQNRGRRPATCVILRPQAAHAMFRVRAGARLEQLSSSSLPGVRGDTRVPVFFR